MNRATGGLLVDEVIARGQKLIRKIAYTSAEMNLPRQQVRDSRKLGSIAMKDALRML